MPDKRNCRKAILQIKITRIKNNLHYDKNNENQKQSSLRLRMILVTSANYFFRSIGDGTFLK